MIINHKDLELSIGNDVCCEVDKLVIVGHYPQYNKLVVVQRRGEDRFFLANRWPEGTLTYSQAIPSRYVVIGDPDTLRRAYDQYVKELPDLLDNSPALIPLHSTRTGRIMIAGAEAVYVDQNYCGHHLLETLEFQVARREHRVFIISEPSPTEIIQSALL